MSTNKTEKELAFLHDLFIATDWTERFAELIDDHISLPKKGEGLYLGAGTGSHVIALQDRIGPELTFIGIEEREEFLLLARAKAEATKEPTKFSHDSFNDLNLPDNHFDVVIGDLSLVAPQRIPITIAEMVRVTKPGSLVAFTLTSASSFGEFFSIFWEAVHDCDLEDYSRDVERLILELPTISELEELAQSGGLREVSSAVSIEEFDYQSGEQFLSSPLISGFLLDRWVESIPGSERERVLAEISRIIDEERHETDFSLTVKATIITGRKSQNH